jgi:NADPH-dependent ferric siderophore reductase
MTKHDITRHRMEVRRRKLNVSTKEHITPRMLRIRFTSDELQGFQSPSPDDHIKIFVPEKGGAGQAMRDFTPRAFDADAGTLTLDFALHERGPAIEWAKQAQVGDVLEIGGPRGSAVVPDDFDWYLLIGDETALPSIGRRVEGLREGVAVSTFVVVDDIQEQQEFRTRAQCTSRWITRNQTIDDDTKAMRAVLEDHVFPKGEGFIWIAAETSVARELYKFLTAERYHRKEWIKAAGYWSQGLADAGERIA